jgi:squalene synthase HpnC
MKYTIREVKSSGIEISGSDRVDLKSAREYCRKLARGHYENFIVGSILVPRKYMQHLYNIYAFCRISDDLADEVGDSEKSLDLLHAWREDLGRCYAGQPTHPAMVALQDTISQFDIPAKPFEDLISAFEQDCRVSRYDTFSDVLDYCERSANPVGRIFLWVFGYRDEERLALSDDICIGLQLANFWQDVAEDYARGRIYIPREDLEKFGCSESGIAAREMSDAFTDLIRFEVDRAREFFDRGAALPKLLDGRVRIDVELFRRGGMAILEEIRRINYEVILRRPTVSKWRQAQLFLRCLIQRRTSNIQNPKSNI